MILGDLSDAITECSVDAIVTRHVSVGLIDGRKVDPRVERFSVKASITPITGKDIRRLGEGQISSGSKLIITPRELFTVKSSDCRIADVLEYKGVSYQISVAKDWYDLGGFYECVGTQVER